MLAAVGGVYAWAQVREVPRGGDHLLVMQDEKEITVVTAPENLASLDVLEVNRDRWRMIALDPATPFYDVGFIAGISERFAAAGIDILVISTYSRDVFFVKDEETDRAVEVLSRVIPSREDGEESPESGDSSLRSE